MKSLSPTTALLSCFLIFVASPVFASKYVYDPDCDCMVPIQTGPEIEIPKTDPSTPPTPYPKPIGRCTSGPPGLNGNPPGVDESDVKLVVDPHRPDSNGFNPCDISNDAQCENPKNREHLVVVSEELKDSGAIRNKLVVVLPGSSKNPATIQWLLKSSAYAGYRTIGLAYQGKTLKEAIGECPSSTQMDSCLNDFRREVVYGGVRVDQANAIKQRLIDLLEHLVVLDPKGGWGAYLDDNSSDRDLRYARIIIAGYSLGSGHAAYWAKDERFGGLFTLAGPSDRVGELRESPSGPLDGGTMTFTPILASWITGTHATPGDRRVALFHLAQPGLSTVEKAWDAFGLSRHAPTDLTHYWDSGQVWGRDLQQQRFTISTSFKAKDCSAHGATAADDCVKQDYDHQADVPRAFRPYMYLFCSVDSY